MVPASADRTVLVHDYLLTLRGAERTFAAVSGLWPGAPILTLLYDEEGTARRFAGRSVTTSPLQRLGVRQRGFRKLLPLFAAAAERLPTGGFDCIVSSSSAFAHGAPKDEGATHICYCHSPFRYAWQQRQQALSEMPAPLRPALAVALHRHRAFDRRAASSVDQFIANSEITRRRISAYWGRDSVVVHPPVDVDRFHPQEPQEYVLFVGELVRHKRAELAIEAAMEAGRRIKVVGTGNELTALRRRYDRAEFVGRVDDEELASLYAGAAALIIPNVEEFGIAAVEAQASGRPVVAVAAGGALETVVHGRTGILVSPGDRAGLAQALRRDLHAFDPAQIRAHAGKFSRPAFETRLSAVVGAVRDHGVATVAGAHRRPRGDGDASQPGDGVDLGSELAL